MAIRWTMAFVEPPMACRTTAALWNDSAERIVCGACWFRAAETALAPVCSAMRSLAADTAGAEAPGRGISPRAAAMQAIVLAVPMTPQVPIYPKE